MGKKGIVIERVVRAIVIIFIVALFIYYVVRSIMRLKGLIS